MAKFAAIAGAVIKIVTGVVGGVVGGAAKLASGAAGLLSGGGGAATGGALSSLGASGFAPGAAALAGGAGLTSAATGFLSGAGPTLLGGAIGAGIGGSKDGLSGALKGGLLGAAGGYGAGQFASGFSSTAGSLGAKLAGGAKALYSGAGGIGSKTGFNLGSIVKAGAPLIAGGLTKAFGPKAPTAADFAGGNPVDAYKNIRTYVGDSALQQSTGTELNRMVSTPLNELAGSYNFGSDRTIRKLNEAFDKQIGEVKRQAANSGQSVNNSSDVRNRIDEIERNRATAISETEQELNNYAMTQAIQAKQGALSDALAQNQFDDKLAFELADLIGKREFLEAAIRQGNVEDFQSIMAEILQIGFGGG